jgi:hypothetical protein
MHYYWCTDHNRVETDKEVCPGNRVLGPYKSRAEAEGALQRISERETRFNEEDARWSGDN